MQEEKFIVQKEIAVTKLYKSMIKDTKDALEEYFKLNDLTNDLEKIHCLYCFINDLRNEIEKGIDNETELE